MCLCANETNVLVSISDKWKFVMASARSLRMFFYSPTNKHEEAENSHQSDDSWWIWIFSYERTIARYGHDNNTQLRSLSVVR